MYEIELRTLLSLAAKATSIPDAETCIMRLNTMKGSIERLPQSLVNINQLNRISKMKGILIRRIRELKGEREFTKRDHLRDERVKKFDRYKVRPLENEITARKGYRK